MLKVASILLRIASVVMLMVFCWQLFQLSLIKFGRYGGNGGIGAGFAGDDIVSDGVYIDFIVRYVAMIVGAYAGGQLIDLFISIDTSLRALVNRTRPASLINRGEPIVEREPELPQR
jgi:hypothetical protein